MRIQRTDGLKLWLSANDTFKWAHRAGNSWPCSFLSDKRVFVEYDSNGDLIDIAINGKIVDCDSNELNAIIKDHLPANEPISLNI